MFDAPDQKQAWKQANRLIEEWSVTYPDLLAWLEETTADTLAMGFTARSGSYYRFPGSLSIRFLDAGSHFALLECACILLSIQSMPTSKYAKLMQFEPDFVHPDM